MKKKKIFFTGIILFGALVAGGAVFFWTSTAGGLSLARWAIQQKTSPEELRLEKAEGSLAETLILREVDLSDPEGLPPGSQVRIQTLSVTPAWRISTLEVSVENGRVILPDSNPILFFGTFQKGQLKFNVSTSRVDFRHLLDLFSPEKKLRAISGTLRELDAKGTGSLFDLEFSGRFHLEDFSNNTFLLEECPGSFTFTQKGVGGFGRWQGKVKCEQGMVTVKRTKIRLESSQVIFSGDFNNPLLQIRGTSDVEGVSIRLVLTGTQKEPKLALSSEPPMAEGRLLLMLATGQRWRGTEEAFERGELTAQVAKDFIDYFVFGSAKSALAEKLRKTELSIRHDAEAKGVSVMQPVSEQWKVGYGIETPQSNGETPPATHQFKTEYRIDEKRVIGLEADKVVTPEGNLSPEAEGKNGKESILLKYKQTF